MSKRFGPLAAVIVGVMAVQVANSILGILVPLQMGLNEQPTPIVGVVVAAYSVGFLVSCLSAPAFIQSIGHIRAFAALAAIVSVTTLAFVATDHWLIWAVLRFCTGLCIAALFAIAESWISGVAPSQRRGQVIAIYMICNKAGIIAGQGVLALGDAETTALYILACACFSLSLVPVALTRARAPALHGAVTLGMFAVYRIAPVGLIGCLGAGLINGAVLGLIPVYGLQIGMPGVNIPLLVLAAQFGSLALQWPLGWLSDRFERRRVIATCFAVVASASVVIVSVSDVDIWWQMGLFGLWGGFSLSVYSICVAHASDHAEPPQILPLITSLLLAWGTGSAIGPAIATAAMAATGPKGLFGYAAGVAVLVGAFVIWRMTRRSPVDANQKEAFVNLPTTSPNVGELSPNVETDTANHGLEPQK